MFSLDGHRPQAVWTHLIPVGSWWLHTQETVLPPLTLSQCFEVTISRRLVGSPALSGNNVHRSNPFQRIPFPLGTGPMRSQMTSPGRPERLCRPGLCPRGCPTPIIWRAVLGGLGCAPRLFQAEARTRVALRSRRTAKRGARSLAGRPASSFGLRRRSGRRAGPEGGARGGTGPGGRCLRAPPPHGGRRCRGRAAELQVFRKLVRSGGLGAAAEDGVVRPRLWAAAVAAADAAVPAAGGPWRWRGPALGALLVLRPADAAAGGHGAPHGAGLPQRLGGGVLRLLVRPLHRLRPDVEGTGQRR